MRISENQEFHLAAFTVNGEARYYSPRPDASKDEIDVIVKEINEIVVKLRNGRDDMFKKEYRDKYLYDNVSLGIKYGDMTAAHTTTIKVENTNQKIMLEILFEKINKEVKK